MSINYTAATSVEDGTLWLHLRGKISQCHFAETINEIKILQFTTNLKGIIMSLATGDSKCFTYFSAFFTALF